MNTLTILANEQQQPTWDTHEIEHVFNCPACNNTKFQTTHTDVQDWSFGTTIGNWSFSECNHCQSLILASRPKQAFIHRAYQRYYTHAPSTHETQNFTQQPFRRKMHERLAHSYIQHRYVSGTPLPLLTHLYFTLRPNKQLEIDQHYRHLPAFNSTLSTTTPRLLDFGCGDGLFLQRASQLGWQTWGCDFDEQAIKGCQNKGLNVFLGGFELLNEYTPRFDVITLSHVIEHVYEPLKLLQQAYQFLKPGGLLWCETPNTQSAVLKHYGRHWRGLEAPRHLVIFNESSLIQLVKQAGFENIQRLKRPNPAEKMIATSELISKQQLPEKAHRVNTPELKNLLRRIQQHVHNNPEHTEFITLSAIKGG